MEQSNSAELLLKFKNLLEKPTKQWWTLFIVFMLIFAVGLYALYLQIRHGHIVTGMRDHVVWGVFIVDFIFFLGFSYAGALISCIFHLAKIKWGKPLVRLIEIMTFVSLCVGPLFIFLCVGRLDRLHYLFIYARIQSPIIWDVIAIITDLVFCFAYLYITHIRDFAMLRDTKSIDLPKWKRNLFTKLSLGFEGRPEQNKFLNSAQNILAVIIIPTSIIAYSLLAWLFGMSLRPGWHSTIFAPHFVLTAVYSGVALLIVLAYIYRKIFKLKAWLKDQYFYYLGFGMLILILFYSYFTLSEYMTEWYNVNEASGEWLNKFITASEFGWHTFFTYFFSIAVPIIVLAIPKLRTVRNIAIAAFLVIIGLWLRRYLIIVPTLETPFLPIQDVRPEFVKYSATWIEWALTAAGVALGGMMFMLLNLLAPVIPVSELDHEDDVDVPTPFYSTLK